MNSLKPMLLTSLKSYDRTQFVKDVTAGIIVAIIATTSTSAPIAITLLTLLSLKSTVFTSLNSHTQWVF